MLGYQLVFNYFKLFYIVFIVVVVFINIVINLGPLQSGRKVG